MSSQTKNNFFRSTATPFLDSTIRVLARACPNAFRFHRLLGGMLLATACTLIALQYTQPSFSLAQAWMDSQSLYRLSQVFQFEAMPIHWLAVLAAATLMIMLATHLRPFASKPNCVIFTTVWMSLFLFRMELPQHHTASALAAASLSTSAVLGLLWYGNDTWRNGLRTAAQRMHLLRRLSVMAVFLASPTLLADPIVLHGVWRGSGFAQLYKIGGGVGAAALCLLGYHMWRQRRIATLQSFLRVRAFFSRRVTSGLPTKLPAKLTPNLFPKAKPVRPHAPHPLQPRNVIERLDRNLDGTSATEALHHDHPVDGAAVDGYSFDGHGVEDVNTAPQQHNVQNWFPFNVHARNHALQRWPGDESVPYDVMGQAVYHAKQARDQSEHALPKTPTTPTTPKCLTKSEDLAKTALAQEIRPRTALASPSDTNPPRSFPGVDANHPNFPTFPQQRIEDLIGLDAFRNELLAIGTEVFASRPLHVSGKDAAPGETRGQTRAATRFRAVAARNGILLFGPPGNGKTTFAEALAASFKKPLITLTIGDATSMWIGQTTERIRAAFELAHKISPCVLFIDEIDAFLVNRAKVAQAESKTAKITAQLLTEIVNLRKTGSLIIGATNNFDTLDPAAVRDGRFDFKREVPAPDAPARLALLRRVRDVMEHDLNKRAPAEQQHRIPQQDLEQVAERLVGLSVARLVRLSDDAKRWLLDPTNAAEILTANAGA
jgi:MoxR-like ATPase